MSIESLKDELEEYKKQYLLIKYETERVSCNIEIRPNMFYCDDKGIYGVV